MAQATKWHVTINVGEDTIRALAETLFGPQEALRMVMEKFAIPNEALTGFSVRAWQDHSPRARGVIEQAETLATERGE